MKNLNQLTQLELVLLELVAKGQGRWSWYELANALSRRDVPREPDMMIVLKKLATDGFVTRYIETNLPRDRWELTPEGSIVIANKTPHRQHKIIIPYQKLTQIPTQKYKYRKPKKQIKEVISFGRVATI